MCLRCGKTHANMQQRCLTEADKALGRYRKSTRQCLCGARIHRNGGCDHITCTCRREFCFACNRYNSIESRCPGRDRWHHSRFPCPVATCGRVQNMVTDPNGPFPCTACRRMLVFLPDGQVVRAAAAAAAAAMRPTTIVL